MNTADNVRDDETMTEAGSGFEPRTNDLQNTLEAQIGFLTILAKQAATILRAKAAETRE